MNHDEFLRTFLDYLAPKMDAYEQIIYLYVYRHTVLESKDSAVIGFNSARQRMATGIGESGKPMAANTAHKKIKSLEQKGYLRILGVVRERRVLSVVLPTQIENLIPEAPAPAEISLEDIDFFNAPESRILILKRDNYLCFYCQKAIDEKTYVLEHFLSRPGGNNSYRNLVAACRTCNNRKGANDATDFLRQLYRDSLLSDTEFRDRINALESLTKGELVPEL